MVVRKPSFKYGRLPKMILIFVQKKIKTGRIYLVYNKFVSLGDYPDQNYLKNYLNYSLL